MRYFFLTIFVILLCWSILGEARNILNDVYSQFKDENNDINDWTPPPDYENVRTTEGATDTTTENDESLYEDDLNYDQLDPRQYTMGPTVAQTTFQPTISTRPDTTTIGPPNDLKDY